MISLYVNALLCTLQHIVIYAMQLSCVNSPNWHSWVAWQYAAACTKAQWPTRRSFSAPSLTSKYLAVAFVEFLVQSPRPTPTLVYETAGRFFVRHSVYALDTTSVFVSAVCCSKLKKVLSLYNIGFFKRDMHCLQKVKLQVKQSLYRPGETWGFQEVEVLRFQDNRHMKVVMFLALHTGRLFPPPPQEFPWSRK